MVALPIAAAVDVVGLLGEVERWVVAERRMPLLGHSMQFDGQAGADSSLIGVQSPGRPGVILNLLPLIQRW